MVAQKVLHSRLLESHPYFIGIVGFGPSGRFGKKPTRNLRKAQAAGRVHSFPVSSHATYRSLRSIEKSGRAGVSRRAAAAVSNSQLGDPGAPLAHLFSIDLTLVWTTDDRETDLARVVRMRQRFFVDDVEDSSQPLTHQTPLASPPHEVTRSPQGGWRRDNRSLDRNRIWRAHWYEEKWGDHRISGVVCVLAFSLAP
jgi:hypothetical protein